MNIKKLFNDTDKILLFFSLLLCFFGLFNIVNVSSQEATNNLVDKSIYYYFNKQLAFIVIGMIASLIIMFNPLKRFNKFLLSLFVGILSLNALAILLGVATRGATNWVRIGPIGFQPSEFAKPIIIFCLAVLFEKFAKVFKNNKIDHSKHFAIILIVGLSIPALVFLQKDIGTLSIIAGIFLVMFVFSPIQKQEKLKLAKLTLVILLACALVYFVAKGSLLTKAQKSRLNYFDPCDSEKFSNDGYQICNAFIAINRGGLTGVGIGKSTQKYSYIPEPHTDMVFAIISEEYGFIVGAAIIIIYGLIIYRILDLATYASTISGRFICIGVATYIFLHIFINLGGMFGIIPLTGVPLPFLSCGGSFTLSLIVSLALVQRVHIDTKRTKMF